MLEHNEEDRKQEYMFRRGQCLYQLGKYEDSL